MTLRPSRSVLPRRPLAVVFDMDGLLLESETIYRAAHQAASEALGYPMDHVMHSRLIGMPRDQVERLLAEGFGTGFVLSRYDEAFRAHFDRLCEGGIPLRPGAALLLDRLDDWGIPRAVATSTDRTLAARHLREAGILDRFAALVTRSDVSRGKPDPETFRTAAERLDVSPTHCLALEDSHNGVRAAAGAGMMTVMVPNLLPATDEMRGLCVAVRDSLAELVADIEAARD